MAFQGGRILGLGGGGESREKKGGGGGRKQEMGFHGNLFMGCGPRLLQASRYGLLTVLVEGSAIRAGS
jgi:hypothetical protein